MKELKYLHFVIRMTALWCLVATTYVDSAMAEEFTYDSSIQRSNFLSANPDYTDGLEKQIEDRRAQLLWKLRFDAEGLQTDQNQQSQSVGAAMRSSFKYQLLDKLHFKAKANLVLQSGRSQDIFGDLEPNSGIYPQELKLNWEAVEDVLVFDAGQIHQGWLNQSLFIGNLGFPGASEKIQFKRERFKAALIAQQLIPTSSTLSTRVGERESTPTLHTETAEIRVYPLKSNFVFGRYTQFRYSNLPSVVSYYSSIYGNSPSSFGNDINNSQFKYDFSGFMGQIGFEQKFTDSFSAQIQHDIIKNNEAPDSLGEAQSTAFGLANDFGRWIVGGRFTSYFIESDAVPAFYNSHRLGHNNRIGNSFELTFESKDWGVQFSASYTKADLLRDRGNIPAQLQQDNQQTFYFKVETMYDFI